jgi:hypothetical protein
MIVRQLLLQRAVLFSLLAMTLAQPLGASPSSQIVLTDAKIGEHEIYQKYNEYIVALSDEDANASTFFSKSVNEEWLALVLKKRITRERDSVIAAVRNRMRFGDRIAVVHEATQAKRSDGSTDLELICTGGGQARPWKVTISYVKEDGQWKINIVHTDTSRLAAGSSGIVER